MHIYTLLKKRRVPFYFRKKGKYPFFRKKFSIDSNRFQYPESEKIYPFEKFNSYTEITGFHGFQKKWGVPLFFEKIFSIDSNRFQCIESEKLYPIEKFHSYTEITCFHGFQKKRGVPLFLKIFFDRS